MVDIVADLHLHSKYSRAVSPQMELPLMVQVARQKGIDLLATGDWTHPEWLREIRHQLEESEEGLYQLKFSNVIPAKAGIQEKVTGSPIRSGMTNQKESRFLLSTEISCIYSQGGKGRRIHNLVFVPSFETAEKVNKSLVKYGYNLSSDGRPIIGLSSKNLLNLLLDIDDRSLLIPAHIWTPWFGIYGQRSGFDSLEEAFEDMAPFVYGIETGLSSDPEMNWHMKELDTRSILSFSDAHSSAKMGREATVFQLENLSYENIRAAIMQPSSSRFSGVGSQIKVNQFSVTQSDQQKTKKPNSENGKPKTENRILYTIEFYPEEGKYHYSGHRKCKIFQTPQEQRETHSICPVCKTKVTDGVMRRLQELASKEIKGEHQENGHGVVWITDPTHMHPPFVKIVPLNEIIAKTIGSPVTSPKVKNIFDILVGKFGSELEVLLQSATEEIGKTEDRGKPLIKIAEGIEKVRGEKIVIQPGYDGLYGTVKIWDNKYSNQTESQQIVTQETLDI